MSAETIDVSDWPISQFIANAKRALADALGEPPTSITCSAGVVRGETRISLTVPISSLSAGTVTTGSNQIEPKPTDEAG